LQVGRLRAGPRATDQQIAAELEVERGKLRVVALGEGLDPLVGRTLRGGGAAQVERHAAEEPPVLGDVLLAERVEGLLGGRGDGRLRGGGRIAACVLEALVAGGGGDEQRRRVGPGDRNLLALGRHLAAGGHHADAGLEL
jgi:hypothetical protein